MIANEMNMKKAIILVVVASAIAWSSCTSYTCPTYSKGQQKKVVSETKI